MNSTMYSVMIVGDVLDDLFLVENSIQGVIQTRAVVLLLLGSFLGACLGLPPLWCISCAFLGWSSLPLWRILWAFLGCFCNKSTLKTKSNLLVVVSDQQEV